MEQILSADLTLDGPPCCFAVDHKNRLWVVQSFEKQPFVVFEMFLNSGSYEVCVISGNIDKLIS